MSKKGSNFHLQRSHCKSYRGYFFRFLKSHFLTKYVEIDMEFSMFNHDHTGVKFSRQMAKNEKKKKHPTSNICPSFLTMFKIFEKL